jgi:phage shock protein C
MVLGLQIPVIFQEKPEKGRLVMGNKLYRSRSNRMIAGVCGGIGEYLDIDPTLVRLILIVLVFLGLSGVLAYIIAWIVIPEDPGNISK